MTLIYRSHLVGNNNNENSPTAVNQARHVLDISSLLFLEDRDDLYIPVLSDDAPRSPPPPVLLLPRFDHMDRPDMMMQEQRDNATAIPMQATESNNMPHRFQPRPVSTQHRRPRKGRMPLRDITVDCRSP